MHFQDACLPNDQRQGRAGRQANVLDWRALHLSVALLMTRAPARPPARRVRPLRSRH